MAVKQVVDIVKELVAQLGFTIVIKSISIDVDGNQVLAMDNTYYLTNSKKVDIGGSQYRVKSFVFNVSITIVPINHSIPVTASTFDLPAPKFFHGTVRSTDPEVSQDLKRATDTRPIAYLWEPITTKNSAKVNGYRQAPIKLFFISLTKYEDKLNTDFLNLEIKPLSNVEAEFFVQYKRKKGLFKFTVDYNSTNHPRFATQDKNGELDLILTQQFTAIELDVTLEINKC